MDKQTKLLLGLGALGVVLYILMKPKKTKDTTHRTLPPDSDPSYLDKETCERYGGTFVPYQCKQAPCDGGTCINATKTILF